MKPTPHVVRDLYAALMLDAALTVTGHDHHVDVQTAVQEIQDSLKRLESLVGSRGIGVVMKDLPAFGKVLDKGLSSGWLNLAKIPHTLGNWSKGTVLFQRVIFSALFNKRGELLTPTADEVLFARQLCYMAKRVRMKSSEESLTTAVEKYLTIEEELDSPMLDWGRPYLYKADPVRYRHNCFALYRRDGVFKTDLPLSIFEVLDAVTAYYTPREEVDLHELICRHGSGAVADIGKGGDKYTFPSWPHKLGVMFPYEVFAFHREGFLPLNAGSGVYQPGESEVPARLSAVPKTLDKPRLITIEPTAHQFLQQGLMRWIRRTMNPSLSRAINFHDQDLSRNLTLEASKSGSLATVDLSDASDRLTCQVIELCFRTNPDFLKCLNACRSHLLQIGKGAGVHSGKTIELKKFAGMGSAVTFPVQTIVYACIAATAVLYDRGWKVVPRNYRRAMGMVRVFGDDIILPSSSVPTLARLLEALQLRVNADKTHWLGHFRESCGMDAWHGYEVTPCYISAFSLRRKPKAEELVSWIDTVNNLHMAGFWYLSEHMVQQIPPKVRRKIVVSDRDLGVLSLRSFMIGTKGGARRDNPDMHYPEVKGTMPVARRELRRRMNYRSLLQYFLEQPSSDLKWVSGREPNADWCSGWTGRTKLHLKLGWARLD